MEWDCRAKLRQRGRYGGILNSQYAKCRHSCTYICALCHFKLAVLTEYRDKWLDSWLEAVDSYNYDVWQQTVQDLQQKLNTWNDEIWGGTWGESNLAEKSGLTILKTIDVIADHVPVLPESRIIVNDAEGLVPKPNKVAGDRKMWPQGPYDTFPSVFVEYSGTTDPTQAMTIHYTATPSHLY